MDQYGALIQFQIGRIHTTPIDSAIWNNVAALPMGTLAIFLLDHTHSVIDAMP